MVSISWHNGEVPQNLETKQVYGLIFTTDGRLLLKVDVSSSKKVSYSLAGGRPEVYDKDRIATLKRELIEEVNTEIYDQIEMVGYQTVSGDRDLPDYAQVRMAAIIKKIGPKKPDPDNGETYDRLLTSPENAIKLLNWDIAKELISQACKIAREKLGIVFNCLPDEFV